MKKVITCKPFLLAVKEVVYRLRVTHKTNFSFCVNLLTGNRNKNITESSTSTMYKYNVVKRKFQL